jgi:hypothetical protein
MCYFSKNVMKFLRELCYALIELCHLIMNMVTGGDYVCTPCRGDSELIQQTLINHIFKELLGCAA